MTTSNTAYHLPPTPPAPPDSGPLEPAGLIAAASPNVRRPHNGPRSLTAKITIGVVALVVVLVASISTITYFALKDFLYDRLDQQLAPVAGSNASRLQSCLQLDESNCDLNGPGNFRAAATEWLIVLDVNGRSAIPVQAYSFLKAMQLSSEQQQSLAVDRPTVATMVTRDGKQLQVAARIVRTTSNGGQTFIVVSGLSTDDVVKPLNRLVKIEIIIGLAAVVVALLATTFGVRFSMRRLRRVTVTAQEVATELSPTGAGLDRRVPDDEPDTEVGQLATSFNTMLAAVENQFAARLESENRLRQFLADASHELRTPLTSIRGYAELARMQRAVGDNASDNLDRIESEGTRMSRLVEDLLMLARGDASATDGDSPLPLRESIDIAGLLDDVVSSTRAAFPDRPVELQVAAVADVIGDRDQLLRAVRNLVTNACVHTEAGRPIAVRGFTQGGGVVITVVDGGPGLPPDQAAHVFERFWRADKARTRARGGTGLGMSIVATVVRAHGGSVRFESTVEHGSTVTLWLPVAG